MGKRLFVNKVHTGLMILCSMIACMTLWAVLHYWALPAVIKWADINITQPAIEEFQEGVNEILARQ